jgi:hypothetical protein
VCLISCPLKPNAKFIQYCTISINSAVTRHTLFFLTPEIIFSRFFRFSEIFQKCGKVTCWPNWLKWYSKMWEFSQLECKPRERVKLRVFRPMEVEFQFEIMIWYCLVWGFVWPFYFPVQLSMVILTDLQNQRGIAVKCRKTRIFPICRNVERVYVVYKFLSYLRLD